MLCVSVSKDVSSVKMLGVRGKHLSLKLGAHVPFEELDDAFYIYPSFIQFSWAEFKVEVDSMKCGTLEQKFHVWVENLTCPRATMFLPTA